MLEVANLSLAYGQHRALDGVALNVGRGEIVTILGANGAGKTSLLKAIAGVVRTLPGKRVSLGGRDISALPAHEIVESGLALVPEGRGIFGDLTVKENLLLGANPEARPRRRSGAARAGARAVPAPARTRRPDRAHHERRRTADARDRPRADVQPGYPAARRAVARPVARSWCRNCSQRLLRVREAGVGLLLVEQNAQESLRIADRGYVIENGVIVGHGTRRSSEVRSGRPARLSRRRAASRRHAIIVTPPLEGEKAMNEISLLLESKDVPAVERRAPSTASTRSPAMSQAAPRQPRSPTPSARPTPPRRPSRPGPRPARMPGAPSC